MVCGCRSNIVYHPGYLIFRESLTHRAIALANNLTLVTHNTSEFGRVAGLPLEDWEAQS